MLVSRPNRSRRGCRVLAVAGLLAALTAGTGTWAPIAGADDASDATAQRQEATRLKGLADAQRKKVTEVRAEIDRLAGVVAKARLAEQTARAEETAALAEELEQESRLTTAKNTVHDQKSALGRWAATTYMSGVSDRSLMDLQVVLGSDDLSEASHRIALLDNAGSQQGNVVAAAETERDQQTDATDQAAAAHEKALHARENAQAAAAVADAAMAKQLVKIKELNTLLALADAKASVADKRALAAEAKLRAARSTSYAGSDNTSSGDGLDGKPNVVTGPTGDCKGGDTASFGNGRIPVENLCALWAQPGHYLRADAAYGFNLMSEAYMRTFGQPMCVTDSYRTFEQQVRLKIAKPYLAATPGKSNHGWGIALDLCGGIQRFGTPQHQWIVDNGGQYGWYHPAWAQATGSKPEPWHFQYRW